ncbi:hypothetical protein [Herbiconiux liukaitaii]|uniref:hypothetical protein n=1 Tax=Herbiconiux liukaitaii TaxID=3342799 RepID=UPI0035B73C79
MASPLVTAMKARPTEFRHRPWKGKNERFTRTETGSAIRPFATSFLLADDSVVDDLRRRFESQRPEEFLPLPPTRGRGNVAIDVWVVPADRVAYAIVAPTTASSTWARQPVHVLAGEAYEGLIRAHEQGRLQLPEEVSELDDRIADTTAAAEFRYDVDYATALIGRARRRFGLSLVVAMLGVVLGVVGLTRAIDLGFIVPGVVAAVVGTVFAITARWSSSKARATFGALTGCLVVVSDDGVSLESRPTVRWSQIVTVAVLDRRMEIGTTYNRPAWDWGEAVAHRFSRGTGIGVIWLCIVVAAGDAATTSRGATRDAMPGPPDAGRRPEAITLTPDSVLPLTETVRLVKILAAQARARDIPVTITTQLGDYQDATNTALGVRRR